CNPKLLIADEPTTALDVTVQAGGLGLRYQLPAKHQRANIITTPSIGGRPQTAHATTGPYARQIRGQATTVEPFRTTGHPCTEALLTALPQLEGEGIRQRRLTSIPGRPPDLLAPPEARRFAPRCPYGGTDDCSVVAPELREIRPGHWVRSTHPASERAG